MTVRDRPEETKKALDSLMLNTKARFSLVVVDDCSDKPTVAMLREFFDKNQVEGGLFLLTTCKGSGAVRNYGVTETLKWFPMGQYLYLCDGWYKFESGWIKTLTTTMERFTQFEIVGGRNESYTCVRAYGSTGAKDSVVYQYEKLNAGSMMMSWAAFKKYGPFDDGDNEGEALSKRVVEGGGLVGAVWPPVVREDERSAVATLSTGRSKG